MIADQIREAKTRQEVFSLLDAYIEAVAGSDKAGYLPEGTATLPDGVNDLMQRCLHLLGELDAASKRLDGRACGVIKEVLHVFGNALNRLKLLEHEQHRPTGSPLSPLGMNGSARAASGTIGRVELH